MISGQSISACRVRPVTCFWVFPSSQVRAICVVRERAASQLQSTPLWSLPTGVLTSLGRNPGIPEELLAFEE